MGASCKPGALGHAMGYRFSTSRQTPPLEVRNDLLVWLTSRRDGGEQRPRLEIALSFASDAEAHNRSWRPLRHSALRLAGVLAHSLAVAPWDINSGAVISRTIVQTATGAAVAAAKTAALAIRKVASLSLDEAAEGLTAALNLAVTLGGGGILNRIDAILGAFRIDHGRPDNGKPV